MIKVNSPAIKIAIFYFLISFIWIYSSDKLILLISSDINILNFIQTIKGWLFISTTAFVIYFLAKKYFQDEAKIRKEFQTIFNASPTPICVLNEDGKILMINREWEERSGYKYHEIDTVKKWLDLAYGKKAPEVKKVLASLYSIDKTIDNGNFRIKTKNAELLTWHFTSAPYGIKDGKRTIICTALDVTELTKKENIMIQQSKMAAMGEVLENIAHQWRQPLSTVSTISTAVKWYASEDKINNKELVNSMESINNSIQHLSNTIDDFREFFKPNKKKKNFFFSDIYNKIDLILSSKFNSLNIKIIKNIEPIEIYNYDNALIQVLINILNNAKDSLIENNIKNKLIFLSVKRDENKILINIKDNAKGINEEIIEKIFEPYFTTKHKSQGTGIGLYMSKEIITKHIGGKIWIENETYVYEDIEYTGANFYIELKV